jgi:hypothetical protein
MVIIPLYHGLFNQRIAYVVNQQPAFYSSGRSRVFHYTREAFLIPYPAGLSGAPVKLGRETQTCPVPNYLRA